MEGHILAVAVGNLEQACHPEAAAGSPEEDHSSARSAVRAGNSVVEAYTPAGRCIGVDPYTAVPPGVYIRASKKARL